MSKGVEKYLPKFFMVSFSDDADAFIIRDKNANTIHKFDSGRNVTIKGTGAVESSAFSIAGSTMVIKRDKTCIRQTSPAETIEYSELINAASANSLDMVRLMIKKGADVNTKDENGVTALIGTTMCNSSPLDIAKLLIQKGIDINAKDKDGWTALMWVAFKNSLDLAKILLKNGADVEIKNKNGWTALRFAELAGHGEMTALINDFKVNPVVDTISNRAGEKR